MNLSNRSEQWAAIRALCEGEVPSLELAAAVSGISLAALDECRRKIVERQATEGASA